MGESSIKRIEYRIEYRIKREMIQRSRRSRVFQVFTPWHRGTHWGTLMVKSGKAWLRHGAGIASLSEVRWQGHATAAND